MRKAVLGVTIAAALGLAACGNDDDDAALGGGDPIGDQQPREQLVGGGTGANVRPGSLDFGTVEVGKKSAGKTVTVTAGTCTETDCTYKFFPSGRLQDGRGSSSDFGFGRPADGEPCKATGIEEGTAELAQGESCTLGVFFTPKKPGDHAALVEGGFAFRNGEEGEAPTFQVKGAATPPPSGGGGRGSGAGNAPPAGAGGAKAQRCKKAKKKGKPKKKCPKPAA